MYVTKVMERIGNIEIVAQSIDDLCNKMDKDGYTLVTYQLLISITCNNERFFI